MTITGKWPGKENIDRWKIKKMMDSRQYDPILLTKDIPSGKEFKVYAQELCSKGYVAPNIPTNAAGGGKKKTRKKRGGNGKNNKTKKIATIIKNDITIKGVNKAKPSILELKILMPIIEPTKTGPKIVPMLLAAPNFPMPEDLSSKEVTSAT